MPDTRDFYNDLATHYKLIYNDWEDSRQRQAQVLDGVIREKFGKRVRRVLDAACGIGTQSIGLAERGYIVSASDISENEIQIAAQEAEKRHLSISFQVGDMRRVDQLFESRFDLVMACDNSIPHLLNDGDIQQAFSSFFRAVNTSGGAMISVRDYAGMPKGGKQIFPRHIHENGSTKTIIFDVWDFEGDQYNVTVYIIEDDGVSPPLVKRVSGGRYYCVSVEKLESILLQAGFREVQTIRDIYFQPLILAFREGQRT